MEKLELTNNLIKMVQPGAEAPPPHEEEEEE